MKCAKCGFVSFDFLPECKNCGASLQSTRDGLGITSFKPASPISLRSLTGGAPAKSQPAAAKELVLEGPPTENDLPEIEFGDDLEFAKGPAPKEPAKAAPAFVETRGVQVVKKDELESAGLSLDFDLEEERPTPKPVAAPTLVETPPPVAPAPKPPAADIPVLDEIELDLSQEDIELIAKESEALPPPTSAKAAAIPATAPPAQTPEAPPEIAVDDLGLKLSQDDLDSLFDELKDIPPHGAKGPGASGK